MTHSPAPWVLATFKGRAEEGWELVAADGLIVCSRAGLEHLPEQAVANALLIEAAPELLAAQTMGRVVDTPDFLDWIAARLVNVYGESPNVDFVQSLRQRAVAGRKAWFKAIGEHQ